MNKRENRLGEEFKREAKEKKPYEFVFNSNTNSQYSF